MRKMDRMEFSALEFSDKILPFYRAYGDSSQYLVSIFDMCTGWQSNLHLFEAQKKLPRSNCI